MINGFFIGFALALLLWFFAFLYLKTFVRRRTSPDYILDLLHEDVRQLEAVIDEKTEQELQLLEEKIRSLREICSEAERRIAVLNRELEKQDKEKEAMAALNTKKLVEGPETNLPELLPSDVKQRHYTPAAAEQEMPIKITLSREKLALKPRPVKERIAELQKAGFSPELIAKRLDLNVGEVQLYFKLAEKSE